MASQTHFRVLAGPTIAAAIGSLMLLAGRDALPMPVPGAIALLVVLLASYFGGLLSGLMTSAVAIGVGAGMFSEPGHPLQFTAEHAFRLSVMIVLCPTVAVIVSLLQARLNDALAF